MPLYVSKFYNHNNGKFENISEPTSINHYLHNLPEEKKNKVCFIYGHLAYYGIHEYFSKPCRYITFVRDPLTRVISTYYQYLRRHQKKLPFAPWRKELPPGLSFEAWLQSGEPRISDYMTNFLSQNSEYYDWNDLKMTNDHLARAKAILGKMFFVGLAERANIDLLYLLDLFNVKKYFENRNVTTQKNVKVNEGISNMVNSKNIIDRELYNYAVLLNGKAKKERSDFSFRVSRAYLRRVRSIIIAPERVNFTNA